MKQIQKKRKREEKRPIILADKSIGNDANINNKKLIVDDIQIKSNGKIRAYVDHVNKIFQEDCVHAVCLYAEGSAVSKLTTVLEIAKRTSTAKFSQLISIGDTHTSPCKRFLPKNEVGFDDDDMVANKHISGIYSHKITQQRQQSIDKYIDNESKTNPTPVAKEHASLSSRASKVWMLAELNLASS
ncbi:hypothetical protein BX070DRAFT_244435 [Coemansia spiralis]|nr:hypothetical protein BX070DRAFT_244435 [Coemansia spiralis]